MVELKNTLKLGFLSPIAVVHSYDGGEVTTAAVGQTIALFSEVQSTVKSLRRWLGVVEQALQNMNEPLSVPTPLVGIKEEVTLTVTTATLKLEIRGQEMVKLSVDKSTRQITFLPLGEIKTTWQEFNYFQSFMERNLESVSRWLG